MELEKMAIPTDKKLYARVKRRVYTRMPKHSAYRSGQLVQQYKAAFRKKHGPRKRPYAGGTVAKPLRRWFKEKWTNQKGSIGYSKKSDVYRPTKRVSKKTPKTFAELGPERIRRAQRIKAKTGRVKRF